MTLGMRRVGLLMGAVLALTAVGCGGSHDIPITLDFDGQDWSRAATFVVAVYDAEGCGFTHEGFPIPLYTISTNDDALADIQLFEGDQGDPVGELDEDTYTFVGVGLDELCFIEYIGCEVATIGSDDEIVVHMEAATDYVAPFCNPEFGSDACRCTEL